MSGLLAARVGALATLALATAACGRIGFEALAIAGVPRDGGGGGPDACVDACVPGSCGDRARNGAETDVDCGGGACGPCGTGAACAASRDCLSSVCAPDGCAAASCGDGVQNGTETDDDCGGGVCVDCETGRGCAVGGDCVSGVCASGGCAAARCDDGARNGAETDVDCGGGCSGCDDGRHCLAPTDCTSGLCSVATCVPASCANGVPDGTETAPDCGGGLCAGCAAGLACALARDCASGVCAGTTCAAPACDDGVRNGSESDVDCGGGVCADCATGRDCAAGTDCVSGVCRDASCAAESCSDGVRNGAETDVDCGGGACADCGPGRGCAVGEDCLSTVCSSGMCVAAGCSDGSRDGAETDVDCGGGTCPPCVDGAGCAVGGDCISGDCSGGRCRSGTCGPDFTACTIATAPDRDYDLCSANVCVSPGCGDATCNAPGPSFALPDTDQRLCYDSNGTVACPGTPGSPTCGTVAYCGQDAQYGWDTSHAGAERFARSAPVAGEPIVTDAVTGLVWQGCVRGTTGGACTGTPISSSWPDAQAYCDALTWGGLSDWHLPDDFELTSLASFGRTGPAADPALFPGAPADWLLSGSVYGPDPAYPWLVGFASGQKLAWVSGTNRFVRCVRRDVVTATFAAPRFAVTEPVAGQPVVTDDRTRLVWQGCAAGASGSACDVSAPGSFSWQAALAACESSTWGGATDWRLPNVVELHSVVDDRRTTAPAIDAAAFPATPSSTWFWSSSTAVASPRFAWYVNFVDGYADWAHQNKGSSHFVRCVRAGR